MRLPLRSSLAYIHSTANTQGYLWPLTVFGDEARQGMLMLSKLSKTNERSQRETQPGWRIYHINQHRWWVRDQLCGFTQAALYIWFISAERLAKNGASHFDQSALRLIAQQLSYSEILEAHQRLIICFVPSSSNSEDFTSTLSAQSKARELLGEYGIPRPYQVKMCLAKSGEMALARAINEQGQLLESLKTTHELPLQPLSYPHTFIDDWVLIQPGEITGDSGENWTLDSPILMLQTHVTQSLFRAISGIPSPIEHVLNAPAIGTSWFDAIRFCNQLSILLEMTPYYQWDEQRDQVSIPDPDGLGIRLPTRAEWCYASSGGQSWPYSGSDLIDEVAWSAHNSGSKVHPVAQLKHNDYGLYDMSGNLWEWCQEGPQDEGRELLCVGDHHPKWLLGGSWANHPWVFPIGETLTELPSYRDEYMGFRVVRNLPPINLIQTKEPTAEKTNTPQFDPSSSFVLGFPSWRVMEPKRDTIESASHLETDNLETDNLETDNLETETLQTNIKPSSDLQGEES